MRFSKDGKSILATAELVDTVLSRFQRKAVIGDLESEFGLTRDHLFYLQGVSSYSVQAFSALIDAREAVQLTFDVEKLNGLLNSCLSASSADINKLLNFIDDKFNGYHTVEFKVANNFIDLLYSQLDCILDASKSFKLNCPAETLLLLSKLSGLRKTVLPFLLINKDVFSFKIHIQDFSFGLRAFDTKYSHVHEVISLIQMGADYDFVKNQNGFCDVSAQYFKSVRKIYGIEIPSVEKISVKKKLDVHEMFNEFLDKGLDYKNAIISTHKKSTLKIELITKILKRIDVVEDDDDVLEYELDELHRILEN